MLKVIYSPFRGACVVRFIFLLRDNVAVLVLFIFSCAPECVIKLIY